MQLPSPVQLDEWWAEAFAPPPQMTPGEWADAHRVLSSVSSGEPGAWRTERTPYLREMMEQLSHKSDASTVVIMKGSQLGGTEVILNWLGSNIHLNPGPAMVVHPTVDNGKRWSKQKLSPMIKLTPPLKDKIKDPRSRDSGNEILMKEYPGGMLAIGGSNSPAGLRQISVRDAACDDYDGFAPDAGGEGDPGDLIENRQATFSDSKTLLVSTPTEKGFSNIERAYEQTDQRKYFVPCVNCGEFEPLTWAQIKWPEGQPLKAYCECLHCGFHMQNFHKNEMLAQGEWRPTAEPKLPGWVGYHLSGLYSPHGWESWGQIAVKFLKAKGIPEKLRVWINTKLAETFEDQDGEILKGESLLRRREAYSFHPLPDGVAIIIVTIDVQDDRLEVQVDGYGRDSEYFNLDHVKIIGDPSFLKLDDDPNNLSVWNLAKQQLQRVFQHPRYGELKVAASGVDTGGHHTLKAYEFCRTVKIDRVWALKGKAGKLPLWPRKPTRKNKGKVPLYIVGVDAGKSSVYSNLRIEQPGPSYRHYPEARDEEYFNQLTSERKRTKYSKGFPTHYWFLPSGQANEALDLSVYSLAVLHGLFQSGVNLNKRVDKLNEQYPATVSTVTLEPSVNTEPAKPKAPVRDRQVRRSSYMD